MASTARLDELKKKFDENPRRYFAPLANEHRKSGDLDQAISLCRTHLPQQPGHISGHIVLAQALYEAGSLDESRDIFHTALGLDPENLIALRYLGDIARDASDVETARSWYQRVLEVDPRNDEIAQMIRELDAPRPAPIEAPSAEAASSFAPPPAPTAPVAPAAPVAGPVSARDPNNDARFAPLSLEEIDLDETLAADAGEAETSETGKASGPAAESLDIHASWEDATSSVDPVDTPGVDPFDLGSGASADSLFATPPQGETHDFFLTELAGAGTSDDGSEASSHELETWSAEPTSAEPQSPESYSPESHTEPTPIQPHVAEAPASHETKDESSDFEEGAFYLEAPPAAPTEVAASDYSATASAESDGATTAAESVDEPNESATAPSAGMDAFAAEYYAPRDATPETPAPTAERESEDWFEPAQPAPNAEPVASAELAPSFADQATAEWEPLTEEPAPPAPASEALGLEVMEFVPPSAEQQPPSTVNAQMPDTDPVIGRTPQLTAEEQRVAPAAFVTETMAELYLQQGFRNEALEVYRELLARNPADASLRERIEQIENGSISSVGMAMVSENVVESALRRQSARPTRSVRSFFASLASRRAPVQPLRDRDSEAEPGAPSPVSLAEQAALEEPTNAAAPTPIYDAPASPQPVAETIQPHAERVTPLMSAAETLATFDPFADTAETESWAGLMPNETLAPPAEAVAPVSPAPAAPRMPTPAAVPVASHEPTTARRSLEDLFPDTPRTARTEVAAQTLATAFGRPEPQGRPTRAASNELSLDHVFRGAPEGAPPADGGFSFDQFFSDSRTSGAEAQTPATSAPDMGRSSGSGDAHDIEQFTAWLEGLKKK